MAEAMIGEIRFFPYRYAPEFWLECNGAKYDIRNYAALYATIGILYGGDGKTYFQVPNLQGQSTVSAGQGPGLSHYTIGKPVGSETVPLPNVNQLPAHSHTVSVQVLGYKQEPADFTSTPKSGLSYASRYWHNLTQNPPIPSYLAYNPAASQSDTNPSSPVAMAPASLAPAAGGLTAHENRQPYLVLRPCICWNGYFAPKP